MTAETSTEVVQRTPTQVLVSQVRSKQFLEQVGNALPGNVTPQRFVRVALTAIQQTPELVLADRATLFGAIVRCAQDGLLPDGREAALTTRQGKVKAEDGSERAGKIAVYMPMIGGYRKIAAKHGMTLVADVVRQKDTFDWTRMPPRIEHKPALGDRGEIVCAYAAAFDRDWRFVAAPIVMDVDEIEKVRAVSSAATHAQGPWVKWWERMACKTVARRLFKELPLGDLEELDARIVDAADVDVDLPDLQQGLNADEADLAAGLGNGRPPADRGPDDTNVEAATPEQHGELLHLVVQLTDVDQETDWQQHAVDYAADTFAKNAIEQLNAGELEQVLQHLREQLPEVIT